MLYSREVNQYIESIEKGEAAQRQTFNRDSLP